MSRFLSLIFLLFLSFLSVLCLYNDTKSQDTRNTNPQKIYRYPLRDTVKSLDPTFMQDIYSHTIIPQIFDGLVQYDNNLNIIPSIAESWKISEDGLIYTFYLRKGVRFHNGREVKAQDFVYSFKRLLSVEESLIPMTIVDRILGAREFTQAKTDNIEGLKTIDNYTFEIRLKERYSPLLYLFATTFAKIVPREEVEKGDFGRHPIGTGPFKFVEWKGNEIILEANQDYFEGRPFLDRLIYKVFPGPDDDGIYKAFLNGELENFMVTVAERKDMLSKYQIIKVPTFNLHIYGFNNNLKPLDNKKIRQAIAYAIDRDRIVKELGISWIFSANGIIPPGMQGYTPDSKNYVYNPEKARALLKETGYPDGKGLPVIEFWTSSKTKAAKKEREIIEDNLNDIGIRIKKRYALWPDMEKMMKQDKLAIFRFAYFVVAPDPESLFAILFDSSGTYNHFSYKNKEVDRLIDDARYEMDILKRVEMYRKVEQMVLEDAPMVVSLFYAYEQIFQPYVKGIEITPLGEYYIPMKKVWFEQK